MIGGPKDAGITICRKCYIVNVKVRGYIRYSLKFTPMQFCGGQERHLKIFVYHIFIGKKETVFNISNTIQFNIAEKQRFIFIMPTFLFILAR